MSRFDWRFGMSVLLYAFYIFLGLSVVRLLVDLAGIPLTIPYFDPVYHDILELMRSLSRAVQRLIAPWAPF